jgi:hypothetical protein
MYHATSSHLWRFCATSRIVWKVSVALVVAVVLAQAPAGQPTTIPDMWSAWCARCHAEDGSGKVTEPTITVEPMDFTECRIATPEPDADWERAIAKGGPGVGLSSEMPGFEDSLTPEQIAGFVHHIRGFCKQRGWPIGNTNFPRPIVTEKAFPENEFLILPVVSHKTDVRLTAVYERRIGRRAMFEIGVPLDTKGVGDVEAAIKYAAYASDTSPRIVSLGLEATTKAFEPFVSAGTTLRDWYLQAQAKVELPIDRLEAGRAFAYNLYVGRDTSSAPDTWTFGLELNGENDERAVTPQIRKGLTKTGALAGSLGVMIPLNKREEQGVRWVGYLLWEYLDPVRARR